MTKDRRSDTSVLNLAEYIPQALDPAGTLVVSVRLPVPLVEAMDRARDDRTRSEYVRSVLESEAGQPREDAAELREDILAIANALGTVYEPDMGPVYPGSVTDMLQAIRNERAEAERLREALVSVTGANTWMEALHIAREALAATP